MKYASNLARLAALGGAKWEVHNKARALRSEGRDIIELTIGEPDVPPPDSLIKDAEQALRDGRIAYSDGRGEANLREALARKYAARSGRHVSPDQVLCFPGTQTALYVTVAGLIEAGDEVLVGDPMYATYEAVIAASGGIAVGVPLRASNGFRMTAEDAAARVTPRTRAILLNTPHNPTGAVLSADTIGEIAELAARHDLWILSDEVYEEMVFDGVTFVSPFDHTAAAPRTIAMSSISKSHAAPGFRSGWAVGPAEAMSTLLPLSETILFGNQPFIADMTARAVDRPSPIAREMVSRFARRATGLTAFFEEVPGIEVHAPEAGMFALLNVAALAPSSDAYALDLLKRTGVAVMPGASFGKELEGWVRIALTVDDAALRTACQRIATHAEILKKAPLT